MEEFRSGKVCVGVSIRKFRSNSALNTFPRNYQESRYKGPRTLFNGLMVNSLGSQFGCSGPDGGPEPRAGRRRNWGQLQGAQSEHRVRERGGRRLGGGAHRHVRLRALLQGNKRYSHGDARLFALQRQNFYHFHCQ